MVLQLQLRRVRRVHRLCLALGALVLAACAADPTPRPTGQSGRASTAASALTLPDGFRAEIYASGLRSPTALAWGPENALYITQLSGDENAATGQVVAVAHPGAEPTVVLEALFKPTGLVWREAELYIVAGRDILVSGRDSSGRLATPRPVVEQLPFNSRSEGQIDVLPDGRLLFEASGDRNDPESGRLFTMLPGGQPEVLATGLKNAYAHAVDPAGSVYTTDIHDDAVDGRPPVDEINVVLAGQDYGWPRCNGRGQPATSLGGTTQLCARSQPALATFAANTTPTGLAWYSGADFPEPYRDALYVALWNGSPPQVLRVTLGTQGAAGEATPFAQGMQRPIDVLPDPRGGLLMLDFAAGIVYRVVPVE